MCWAYSIWNILLTCTRYGDIVDHEKSIAARLHTWTLSYQFHTKTLSQKGSKHWRWSRCSPPQQVTRHVQVSTSVVPPCRLTWPAFCSAAKVKRTFSDEVVVLPDKDLLMMSATVCPTLSTWLSQYYNRTKTNIANDRIDCRPRATSVMFVELLSPDIFWSASLTFLPSSASGSGASLHLVWHEEHQTKCVLGLLKTQGWTIMIFRCVQTQLPLPTPLKEVKSFIMFLI